MCNTLTPRHYIIRILSDLVQLMQLSVEVAIAIPKEARELSLKRQRTFLEEAILESKMIGGESANESGENFSGFR